jgi:hypothetical protein
MGIGNKKVAAPIFSWVNNKMADNCMSPAERIDGQDVAMTRVKSGVLVSAALRYANTALIDCVLARRGDKDAGAIFVHIDALDGRHKLLARSLNFEGQYEWHIITKTEWVDAEAASTHLAAEMKVDQDAFIIAVCDAQARNPFDAI